MAKPDPNKPITHINPPTVVPNRVMPHKPGYDEIVVVPVSMTKSNIKLVDDTFEWMRTVHKSWLDQELPKRVFEKKSTECKGCAVFEECSKLWDGTADIPALNLPK